ncbi:MAG: ribosomal protein S18-alanine N-acetyltransferase [Candidatus Neomarinimicrobiota bacterium]
MKIRRADESDLPAVMAIEEKSFPSAWTVDFFRHEMYNPLSHFFVATFDKIVVGYIVFWVIADESHIANLAVHPDYRRHDLGDNLLKFAIHFSRSKGAKMITLEVNEKNVAAFALYEKNEFKQVGKRIKYYENRDDAFILTRIL